MDVTLLDRRNYHLFQPLLYRVATAALSPSEIASPIRHLLREQANAQVLLAEATGVGPGATLRAGPRWAISPTTISWSPPSVDHSYFGHPEWSECGAGR